MPLGDEFLPTMLAYVVHDSFAHAGPMAVTVVSRTPETPGGMLPRVAFRPDPASRTPLVWLNTADHIAVVQLLAAGQKPARLPHGAVRPGATVVQSGVVSISQLPHVYEASRLTLRLITLGLATSSTPVMRLRFVDDSRDFVYLSRETLVDLKRMLEPLMDEPLSPRRRLARTLYGVLTSDGSLQQHARRLGVSPATVGHHLNRLQELLGPELNGGHARVPLIVVLPTLLHLWDLEADGRR